MTPSWRKRLRWARRAVALVVVTGLWLVAFQQAASADNCGSFSDCFFTADGATWALLGTFISIALDFVPIVGNVKGVIEAITGRDLITGQELEPWERALGILGPLGKGAKVVVGIGTIATIATRADRIADAGGALGTARRGADGAGAVGTATRGADGAGSVGTATRGADGGGAAGTARRGADGADDVGSGGRGRDGVDEVGGRSGTDGPADDFVGTLRGEEVRLPGVRAESLTYTKRTPADTRTLRNAFNSSGRSNFLKRLGSEDNVGFLRSKGFTDAQIQKIQNGKVPEGYQVHHKRPLDDGGDNSFDNLVLIKNEPHHKVITNAQNSLTRGMNPGETRIVDFPIPEGSVYP